MVPLSPTVTEVLDSIPRVPGNPWVIAGKKPDAPLCALDDQWCKPRERADLKNVRIQGLKHSCVSRTLALGDSLKMVGALRSWLGRDDGAVCPSCAGHGEGRGSEVGREYRREHHASGQRSE